MGRPSGYYLALAATAAVICAGCASLFPSAADASSDSIGGLRGGDEGHGPRRLLGFWNAALSRDPATVLPKEAPPAAPGAVVAFDDWTPEEHALFLRGLRYWGNPGRQTWTRIANVQAKARTSQEVTDHWRAYHAAYGGRHGFPLFDDDVPAPAADDAKPWTPEEHDQFLKAMDYYIAESQQSQGRNGPLDRYYKTFARLTIPTRSEAEIADHFAEWIRTPSGPAANDGLPWTEEEEKALDKGLALWGHEDFGVKFLSYKLVPTRSTDEIRDHVRRLFYGDGGPPAWSDGWSQEEHAVYLEGLQQHAFAGGTAPWGDIARSMRQRLGYGSGRFNSRSVLQHTIEYFARRGQGEFAPMEVHEWPPDDVPGIPPGTYSRRAPVRHDPMTLGAGAASHAAKAPWGRVLLYISSHFSMQHQMYLKYCWPNVMDRSQLLQGADVAVHLTPNDPALRRPAMDLFGDVFKDHNLMMFVRNYKGVELRGGMDRAVTKKTGAVMTMYEAVNYNYFEGYDWVIRVNPDVLLRDDSWFRGAMSDPSLSALLVDCHEGNNDVHLHTDFFVVKPEVLVEEAFPRYIAGGGAEGAFTIALADTVLKSDPPNYAWVPDADPMSKRGCRVGEGRDFADSPVVHEHQLHPEVCSVPPEDVPLVHSVFPGGWEKTGWKQPDYSSWYEKH